MRNILCLSTIIGMVALARTSSAQHLHFVAGTASPAQGAKLYPVNGADFVAASGHVRTHAFSSDGSYAGYYNASHPFIVAAATEDYGGPEFGAPALGSQIRMRIVSVSGPPGGQFSFWEAGATSPTILVPVSAANTNDWHISENDGSPGSDPYGHIHGRRFAMTKPGFYVVGFQFFDVCTNGANGGPIHTPSDVIFVNMQAGVSIAAISKDVDGVTVTFGAEVGNDYVLEAINAWDPEPEWTELPGVVTGDNRLQSLRDTISAEAQRYYRVKAVTP
jgi:hypothetical protein